MSNIYEIKKTYLELTDQIIDMGGEINTDLETALAVNKVELEEKGIGYAYVIKGLESDVTAIDEEIKRLQALKSSRNKTIDVLKTTVKDAMQLYGIEEIKTSTLKLSFRRSESVELDPSLLDFSWMNQKITYAPDKSKIKEAIKAGESVPGAWISVNYNLQIK